MKYRCKNCNREHDGLRRTIICCNESTEVTQYRCSECDKVYSNLNSADLCCEDMKIDEVIEE
jgi:DNA-directed RNA polymerase subunit RPC12/RpoP